MRIAAGSPARRRVSGGGSCPSARTRIPSAKRELREEDQVLWSWYCQHRGHGWAPSTAAPASPRDRRWDGGRVKVFTEKDVRVRDHPDPWVGHCQTGEPLVQHADLLHGGGEEVRRVQSGQKPRPECPIEKHIENVVPIEEGACLLVHAEPAPRQEGALGVALPQGVAGHCCCTVVHGSPIQERRVVPYVLSPWSENEHPITGDPVSYTHLTLPTTPYV